MSATFKYFSFGKGTIKLAQFYQSLVVGIVCQSGKCFDDPGFVQMTPGVAFETKGDSLGQCYKTPQQVIIDQGADVAVVGRGVISAINPAETAKEYRDKLWDAYKCRIEM